MFLHENPQAQCVIIGASHAGVTAAFALRKAGWQGSIHLFDKDPNLPYHRPPLSKTCILNDLAINDISLKSEEQYVKHNIKLHLNVSVEKLNARARSINTQQGQKYRYDVLIYACGASALQPKISGIDNPSVFTLRSYEDVKQINQIIKAKKARSAIIIGAGYIGLELAASLSKSQIEVSILEREKRLLQRVTCPEVAAYFEKLHIKNGVKINFSANVRSIERAGHQFTVNCDDSKIFTGDIVIVGVGIDRNIALAKKAGIKSNIGIVVNSQCKTSDPFIYAIGDCTEHFSEKYNSNLCLESVQNANDQAKVAAQSICGKEGSYDTVPWFWSDQYDTKLQTVGMSKNYDNLIIREHNAKSKSYWYFKNETLLAVDAINAPKAYVLAGRILKKDLLVNRKNVADTSIEFKPENIIVMR